MLFAIDPTLEVAEEARDYGAQLRITHHPLFLRGVHGVSGDTPGGAVVQTLIRAGCALYTAHTNADVARPGVSDALADALGVVDGEPIESAAGDDLDKIVVFVPGDSRARVLDAMADAGAGSIGDYDRCAWWGEGTGTFRPGWTQRRRSAGWAGSRRSQRPDWRWWRPEVGALRSSPPCARRIRTRSRRSTWSRWPCPPTGGWAASAGSDRPLRWRILPRRWLRRCQRQPPASGLPVILSERCNGSPCCGGTGGSLAGAAARAGADVLVTADGRHHYVLDAVAETGIALIDVAHWASEWPWLEHAAARLGDGLRAQGRTVATAVSGQVTDPWRLHLP